MLFFRALFGSTLSTFNLPAFMLLKTGKYQRMISKLAFEIDVAGNRGNAT